VEDFLKSINSIKGYKFDKDDHTAIVNTTGRKVDPHLQNLFPVQWNPLYHIGKAVNGWRVAKHKRNIEDVKELQLMVLVLEEERSAKPDKATVDRLTKQIKYHTNRINILNGDIADMMEEGKDV